MQLEHSFSVPVGIDEAWRILIDVERIGPCMPGAAIDSIDGDEFTGTVKVKLGPINLTYKGKAAFVEKDEAAHRAVIDARGRDVRGNGTAAAMVEATLHEDGPSSTTVKVNTDLDMTGKPAQFGRGVMVDVGNKLLGQFADSLAKTLRGGAGEAPAVASAPATADAGAGEPSTPGAPAGAFPAGAVPAGAVPAEPAAEHVPPTPPTGSRPASTAATASTATPDQVAANLDPSVLDPAAIEGELDEAELDDADLDDADLDDADLDDAGLDDADLDDAGLDAVDTDGLAPVPGGLPGDDPAQLASVNGHFARRPYKAEDEVEPISLLHQAGPAVAKRLAPIAVALVVVLLAVRRRAAHRHG